RTMKPRGIDLEIARGFGSMASAQAIATGQFDFGIVAAPSLILSVVKDLPLIALATCDYDATMGVGVLDDSPVQKPQNLAGKKVASVPTSGEFPFFPAYAERVGLAPNSIEFVHVDNKVLDRVLMEKQVDAITSFALGSASAMLSKGVPSRWMLYSAAGIRNHGQTIASRRSPEPSGPIPRRSSPTASRARSSWARPTGPPSAHGSPNSTSIWADRRVFLILDRRSHEMTSQMENELLTRVGPGTPMGALMRQYWVPACLSSEL